MNRDFHDLLEAKWDEGKFLCVGLDPDIEKMPAAARKEHIADTILTFNKAIIDATHDIVCTFKPNPAFYEQYGEEGWHALKETVSHINTIAPGIPVILDAKRGDIGNTNIGYAKMAFDYIGADATTVQPYQGGDALAPFLERKDKGIIVLVKTSNPGSEEFQGLQTGGEPLYKTVARTIVEKWNVNKNCAVVVGATYPEELKEMRAIVGDMPILMPGIGAQGGDLEASVKVGKDSRGKGMIINASRAVIFASNSGNFAEAARAKAQKYDGAIRKALVE